MWSLLVEQDHRICANPHVARRSTAGFGIGFAGFSCCETACRILQEYLFGCQSAGTHFARKLPASEASTRPAGKSATHSCSQKTASGDRRLDALPGQLVTHWLEIREAGSRQSRTSLSTSYSVSTPCDDGHGEGAAAYQ
jgi:hypothetical protein